MGILNNTFDDETSVIIRFDKNGFYINGNLLDENDFGIAEGSDREWPVQPTTYEKTFPDYFQNHFQGVVNLQFGSRQGNTQSWATYEYIKYHHKL